MATSRNEHTRRQAAGLRALRERRGLKVSTLADRLGYSTSQAYELYERAVSVLRLDQVPVWAAAFGVTSAEFSRALGLLDDDAAGDIPQTDYSEPAEMARSGESLEESAWDFRAELMALAPADNPFVVNALALGAGQDEDTQRFLAGIVAKRVAARGVRRTTYPPRAPGAGAPPDRAAYLVRSPSAPGVTPLSSCPRLAAVLHVRCTVARAKRHGYDRSGTTFLGGARWSRQRARSGGRGRGRRGMRSGRR